MSLTTEDVRRIAHLARLAVREEDIPGYAADLSSILTFIEQMESAETDGIEPMAHPQEAAQRLRDDRVTESDRRDDYQAIAPSVEAGLYLVPKVIE